MTSTLTPGEAHRLAAEAYTYGFAMVENYKAIFGMCVWTGSPQYSGFNHYLHGRQLFDSSYDTVVNANNDTLYSTTFADLRAQPLVITVPPTGERYFVIQLVDMGTDNFAYLGTRATGRDGGEHLLVGPHFKGMLPAGFDSVINAPSDFVALATRTAIDGVDNLPAVVAIQDALRLRPLGDATAAPAPPAIDWPAFGPDLYASPALLELLDFLLSFHVPALVEHDVLARVAPLGIGAHQGFTLDRFDADVRAAIAAGCAEAHAAIEARGNSLGTVVDGWQDIPAMGHYGDDYLFRSAVAWKFIYTNSPEEALYPIAETDDDGQPLTGEHAYVVHFPPRRLPPVDAFWSITLYDSTTRLMVDNPIDRYSIGDRTPGLRFESDGSLTIHVRHDSPGPEHEANWLPCPPGRFYLNARAYIPRAELLDGSYRLPAVQRLRAAVTGS